MVHQAYSESFLWLIFPDFFSIIHFLYPVLFNFVTPYYMVITSGLINTLSKIRPCQLKVEWLKMSVNFVWFPFNFSCGQLLLVILVNVM